ncbi:AMP-dependent synthetase/ligase [Spongisporangium articulatum]|uniref:AMP-dependent synthetase/ligase n=1 Tax=Spongisporangium articulatum TaxID=3362603 RepID=A0ABW8ASV5_9ACTN
MREIKEAPVTPLEADENLTDVIVANAAQAPDLPVLSRPAAGGGWEDVTAAEFLADVTATAKGLVASGVEPGDRIGLLCKTRYEWTLFDFAIWFTGAVTVPIYETSSAEQVKWILSDSGAAGLIVETTEHAQTAGSLKAELADVKNVWVIDDGAVGQLHEAGAGVADDEIERRRRTLKVDSVATVIYTSGTTGRPKGCELTHANFLGLARGASAIFGELVTEGKSTLLFLPLAHVFARFIQVLCLVTRARLSHSPSVAQLLDDLQATKPTFLLAVPRVFEKIYNSAEAKARGEGKGRIFGIAADTAIEYSRALDDGGPGLLLRVRHAVFDRLVYSKLRAATGGAVEGAVSGGAPLGQRLGHFFRGIGIDILEGWGLTETTAPATVNTQARNKIGTVGRPLPGVSIRIGDDGELLVGGVGVLKGYWNNEQATAEAITDGWFHTGDLGEIDDDGYVSITGRKKEILVTAGGKNVSPAQLEDRMRAHPLISQAMVVGDGKPFIACLITLDAEMLPGWLKNHGKGDMSVEEAAKDDDVRAELQKAVDDANTTVSKAESIRKFTVLSDDWTEASGHLTPKMSIKRAVVMKDYAEDVEALYAK